MTQDFHVSLRLPYSVRRFEQLQITPVLYNHGPEPLDVRPSCPLESPTGPLQPGLQAPPSPCDVGGVPGLCLTPVSCPLQVRVQLELEEGICAPSGGGQQQVQVPGQGALAVPFSLVPLGAADIPITVSARGQFGVGDSITRTLHVEVGPDH